MNRKYDVVCIGTALVDSIIRGVQPVPVSASGYMAGSGSLHAGGEAVNTAIASSKLGLKTGILCRLGADEAGEMVIRALQKHGVDTAPVLREGMTPVTTIFVHEDGTRKSVINEALRYSFHPEKEPERFTDARAVLLGSLFRAPFDDPEIIFSTVSSAKKAGQTVLADTKLPNFKVMGLPEIRESLALIDYITPNEDEAKYLTGEEEPGKMADVFLRYGIKNVVIKLGGRGCFMKNREREVRLEAYPVRAVDTTGAGDHFAAGLISELLHGKTQEEALLFANACGAVCTTGVGAAAALQSREQMLEWIRNH
jgi:sugar/nucleoside kinase (ribokinase family)